MATFLHQLQESAKINGYPDTQVVLRGQHSQYTLAQLCCQVKALSLCLQQQQVQTLALLASNSPEWLIVDLACQEAGICLLPLPGFFSSRQLQHCLLEAGADALLADRAERMLALAEAGLPANIEPITGFLLRRLQPFKKAIKPLDTSKITFTSGSTGAPKGVCLDNRLQNSVARSLSAVVSSCGETHLCLLPLSTLLENVGGAYRAMLSGATVLAFPEQMLGFSGTGFDLATLLSAIENFRPGSLIVLPELLQALTVACCRGWQLPESLRFIAVGGARVSPGLMQKARHTGLPVYEGYGLSECGSVVSLNTHDADRIGSCGIPLSHNMVTIENQEIAVKGDLFLGYLNEPSSWYPDRVVTGDLATIDAAGFLHIHGRRKNLMISSFGRNINPEWIESEVLANPMIRQCVVFGDAKPYCVALIVARNSNISNSDLQGWLDLCNANLPEYAQVKGWLRLEQPMGSDTGLWTENGRPKRQAIASHFRQAIEQLYPLNSHITKKVVSL